MIDLKTIVCMDKWLQVYLIFKVLDFITGFLKAYKVEGFKSRKLRDGVVSIVGELVALFFAGTLDVLLGLNVIMLSTQSLFIFKEAVSIIENLGIVGVRLPQFLKDKIQDLNPEKDEEENEKEGNV